MNDESGYSSPSVNIGTDLSTQPSVWSREAQAEYLATEPATYTDACIQSVLQQVRAESETTGRIERAGRIYQ